MPNGLEVPKDGNGSIVELPRNDDGGGPAGVKEPAEEGGGGPAGVVEPLESPKNCLEPFCDLFGVDGELDEYGAWNVIAIFANMQRSTAI